jgi:hydrogenase nickel incorporation protein HypA/HybF
MTARPRMTSMHTEAALHELSLARGLVSQAQRIAEQHQARCIDEVVVRVGALSGVEADLLARAFLEARTGSLAERATLMVEERPLEIRCAACGWHGPVDLSNMACVRCGGYNIDIVSGDELVLMRVELSQLVDTDADDGDIIAEAH